MTDMHLPFELRREGCLARIRRGKDIFTKVSVDYLRGVADPAAVAAAVAEVNDARTALRELDDEADHG